MAYVTNSKLLWSKVSLLLQETPASDKQSHGADDFAAFFHGKIEKIRQSTLILDVLRPVMPTEITKIIAEPPAKHCSLDPTPTWRVKQVSWDGQLNDHLLLSAIGAATPKMENCVNAVHK